MHSDASSYSNGLELRREGTLLAYLNKKAQLYMLHIFSSPEPKAQIPMLRRTSSLSSSASLSLSTIFKHEYLRGQLADRNQILSEASLGWGKGCMEFWCRSVQNSGFHGNR